MHLLIRNNSIVLIDFERGKGWINEPFLMFSAMSNCLKRHEG